MAAIERQNVPPATLPVDPDGIPDELKADDQFVGWAWEYRDSKWTKPPLRANGSGYAKSDDPSTWSPFDVVLAAYRRGAFDGIGRMLKAEGEIFFIDLDHCRDPETGEISPWARPILRLFRHTYQEVSPTGTGIKIIGYGRLPGARHVKPMAGRPGAKVEFFDKGKYTTLTGHRCEGAAPRLADCQAALEAVYAELWPAAPGDAAPPTPPPAADEDDNRRLDRARSGRHGADFVALFDHGDTTPYGGDDSSADLALCNMLAFWFGPDPARIDRMFRRSALMRPKWDKKHYGDGRSYGEGTIDTALAGRTEFYQPRQPRLRVVDGGQSGQDGSGGQRGSSGGSSASPPPAGPDNQRPAINAGDQDLERISARAWSAIKRANEPPRLFRFGGVPVRVDRLEDDALPIAQTLTEDRLGHELARAAVWFKETEKEGQKSAAPPTRMIRDMLAAPSYPLPSLISIVQTPVFAPDGSLHTQPGYHAAGRTFYAPDPGFQVPAVPDSPTSEDIARARALITDELLGEFPFVGDAERANTAALFLDPYVRNLIDGPTPLRLIEAPTPGSGKGLLADVVLRPAVGRRINVMPAANDDDEWRKRVTAQLALAPAAILIDNIVKGLDSGSLSSALTATWWTDRRLGAHEMISVPVRCVWLGTANNPTMSTELARRTVRIRLDPKMDRPWRRSGFRYSDLRTWADENRTDLVWAGLVLGRAWIAAGSPLSTTKLGSFERWAAVLGGILQVAGIDGFLGNLEEFYETADVEGAIWRSFVALWAEKHGEAEVGVADLFDLALTVDGFDFGKGTERSQKTSFGRQLTRQRDRVIGDYRIAHTRTVQRIKRWRLIRSRPAGSDSDGVHGVHPVHPCTSGPPVYAQATDETFYAGADMYTDVHDVHMWDDMPPTDSDPEDDPWTR
ncbi:MAG: hypothetical protein M3Q71_05315 [Chloroflexota bacterium]|nr:hypothetical protein [Chloroflexota bacterium]